MWWINSWAINPLRHIVALARPLIPNLYPQVDSREDVPGTAPKHSIAPSGRWVVPGTLALPGTQRCGLLAELRANGDYDRIFNQWFGTP